MNQLPGRARIVDVYARTVAVIECPCGTGLDYGDCCGVIHERGAGFGTTAVALMRARYSAYVRHDDAFLLESWHPDTRPATISFEPRLTWLGLNVIETVLGAALDHEGVVEFKADYQVDNRPGQLHERSRFERVAGYWRYLDAS